MVSEKNEAKNVIVYDLGGTFDVDSLTLDSDVFEVSATSDDTHKGGDFDNRVVNHCIKLFNKKCETEIRSIMLSNRKSQELVSCCCCCYSFFLLCFLVFYYWKRCLFVSFFLSVLGVVRLKPDVH